MIGKDRLVFRIIDNEKSVTYYTRNVWLDSENYRFRDVYGRDISLLKTETVKVDVISDIDYYKTP